MRIRFVLSLAVVVLALLAVPALADSGVVGKWEATMQGPQGEAQIAMEFKGTDEELSGTWTGPRGSDELEDVKWDGKTLTFKRNLEFQGNAFSIDYSATVDGDTMNVTMTTPRGTREFQAKKAG